MNNKKLIFIVSSPRSGSTLLLSYLCGLKKTKILYETKCLTNLLNFSPTDLIEYLANIFDSIDEEILIEKTPEHVCYLDVIEQLRKVCERDIHIIYVTRPPVPTVLSILKAKEALEVVDILGACEKYEESLVSMYHNLVSKTHESNVFIEKGELKDGEENTTHIYNKHYHNIPYCFHVTYRGLTEDSYFTLHTLLVNELHLDLSDSDIRSLLVNRVSNLTKILPQVVNEEHHNNLFKEVDVVNKERLSNVSSLVDKYKEEIKYITNYFSESSKRTNIYNLVTKKQTVEVTKNPLVTIVVSLYNKEKYIVDTLNSLLDQTYNNIRIIVIDDASTDKSLEIVEDYYRNLPYLFLKEKMAIIKNKNNQGVSSTRNFGFSSISKESDVISFCDADDIWDSTLIEKSVATFKKYPYIDCVYSRVLVDKDGEVTKNHSKICNGDVYEDALEYNFLTCGSNIFVKASIIQEHSIRFNVEYKGCEDWDFLIQLAKVATFKCTKEYLVTYRQVPNSLSTNRTNELEGSKKVLESYLSSKDSKFSRIFTRLYLYYFSTKNLKWRHIRDLDYSFIMRVVISKLKSLVKSYLP